MGLLYVFIEGNDDERFFETVIKPIFEKKYDSVIPWKYACEKNEKCVNFLRSIESMGADYIILTDNDGSPCVTDRKQNLQHDITNIKYEKVIVVIWEIESWYLAGLNDSSSKKLGIKSFTNTEHINKSAFNDLIPKKFESRIDFMIEVLKHFCADTAIMKNNSFKYFFEKFA
jgi:hypothetical protein